MDLDTFFAQQKEDEREMEQEKVEKKREKKTKLVEKRKKKVEKVPQEQQWLVSDEDFTGGRWFECAPEWPVDPKGEEMRRWFGAVGDVFGLVTWSLNSTGRVG